MLFFTATRYTVEAARTRLRENFSSEFVRDVSSHPTHAGFFRAQEDELHTRADAGDPVFVVASQCMFFQQAH